MLKEKISLKKYTCLFIIIVATLGILYYLYLWYMTYKSENSNGLIISNYIQGINYNDLDNYIVENSDVTLYVFSSNNGSNSFENKLINIIINNNLQKKIVYLDIAKNLTRGKFNISNIQFDVTPLFVTFNNGEIVDSYNIKKYNYDIKKIENYLESVGVIKND